MSVGGPSRFGTSVGGPTNTTGISHQSGVGDVEMVVISVQHSLLSFKKNNSYFLFVGHMVPYYSHSFFLPYILSVSFYHATIGLVFSFFLSMAFGCEHGAGAVAVPTTSTW